MTWHLLISGALKLDSKFSLCSCVYFQSNEGHQMHDSLDRTFTFQNSWSGTGTKLQIKTQAMMYTRVGLKSKSCHIPEVRENTGFALDSRYHSGWSRIWFWLPPNLSFGFGFGFVKNQNWVAVSDLVLIWDLTQSRICYRSYSCHFVHTGLCSILVPHYLYNVDAKFEL